MRGKRIAITGATGFVGHHTALELKRAGCDVIALVRETSVVTRLQAAGAECCVAALDDVSALASALQDCDLAVHTAGAVGFDNDWELYERVNVEGTRNVLAAARRAGVRRVVHTSSIVAVGAWKEPTLADETAIWNLLPYRVPYITTKRLAEEAALAANGSDLEVVLVNPGSVVGPDDYSSSEFGTLCKRFWKRQVPICFGGGNNFVDVRDVAHGICLAAERGRPGERYLITGENCTYHEFFRALAHAAQRWIPCVRVPTAWAGFLAFVNETLDRRPGRRLHLSRAQAAVMGLYFYYAADKAHRELGYAPRPLSESLADAHTFWKTPHQAM